LTESHIKTKGKILWVTAFHCTPQPSLRARNERGNPRHSVPLLSHLQAPITYYWSPITDHKQVCWSSASLSCVLSGVAKRRRKP